MSSFQNSGCMYYVIQQRLRISGRLSTVLVSVWFHDLPSHDLVFCCIFRLKCQIRLVKWAYVFLITFPRIAFKCVLSRKTPSHVCVRQTLGITESWGVKFCSRTYIYLVSSVPGYIYHVYIVYQDIYHVCSAPEAKVHSQASVDVRPQSISMVKLSV